MTSSMWFIRDKQSPEGINRLLCVNGTPKYRAFESEADCKEFIGLMPNASQYDAIELEVED